MKISRLTVVAFVLAAAVSTSAIAAATSFFKVNTGIGTEDYGGGGAGCAIANSGNFSGTKTWQCPIPDGSSVSSWSSLQVNFTNSNTTQPVYVCAAYYYQIGSTCSMTTISCPGGGVCSLGGIDVSTWNNNFGSFKYVSFDKISSGVSLPGYVVYYN
jgi:hypothetical protein